MRSTRPVQRLPLSVVVRGCPYVYATSGLQNGLHGMRIRERESGRRRNSVPGYRLDGATRGIRTRDLRFTKPLLWPAELGWLPLPFYFYIFGSRSQMRISGSFPPFRAGFRLPAVTPFPSHAAPPELVSNSSGSVAANTRPNVSWLGIPCGRSMNPRNHSSFESPNSSISLHPSAVADARADRDDENAGLVASPTLVRRRCAGS